MALGRSCMLTLLLVVGHLQSGIAKQTWTVGDSSGWTPLPSIPFDQWAAGKIIQVGDDLLFSYVGGQHNVLQVTQSDLANCVASKPISSSNGDPAIIEITSVGYHGFISGYPGDCANGMHLSLRAVSAGPIGYNISAPSPAGNPSSSQGPGTAPRSSPPAGAWSPSHSSPTTSSKPPGSSSSEAPGPPAGSTPVGSPSNVNATGSSAPAGATAGSPDLAPSSNSGYASTPSSAPSAKSPARSSPGAAAPTIGSPLSRAPGSSPGAAPSSTIIGSPLNTPGSPPSPGVSGLSPSGAPTSLPTANTPTPTPSSRLLGPPAPAPLTNYSAAPVQPPIATPPGLSLGSSSGGAFAPGADPPSLGTTNPALHLRAVPEFIMIVAACVMLIG